MNLSELRDAAYDFLQQSPTQNQLSPGELDRYLNIGQSDVFTTVVEKDESFFETTGTLTETAGQEFINLPTDLYKIRRVRRVKPAGGSSIRVPFTLPRLSNSHHDIERAEGFTHSFAGTNSRAQPTGYVQLGQKKIQVIPDPKTTVADSLKLYYIFRPAEMTADTHVPFQQTAGPGGAGLDDLSSFHDLIWMLGARYALAKEEATQQMALLRELYNQRHQKLIAHLDNMNVQEPTYMKADEDDVQFDYAEGGYNY